MSDKQHINLTLDSHSIGLDVEREDEPFYRKAQEMLNTQYRNYQRKLPSATSEQIWMYVALHVAVNLYADTRGKDLEPYLKAINRINKEIENKLNIQNS